MEKNFETSGLYGGRPGRAGLRVMKALAVSKADHVSGEAFVLEKRWAGGSQICDYLKAGIPTMTTANTGLMSDVGADFMAALRPLTIIRRLGMRKIPARTRMLTQKTGFRATWIAEGKLIPASGGAYEARQMELLRVAALTCVSNEMLKIDALDVETGILNDLLAACRDAVDAALIHPGNAGTVDVKPPSLTHPSSGGIVLTSTGATIAAIDSDLKAAAQALITAGSNLAHATWVMSPGLALKLSLLRGSGGVPAYPGLGLLGGTLAGLPAITSQGAYDASNGYIALIDPEQCNYGEGEPTLRTSTAAAIDLNAAPGAISMATPISLFQAESTALLVSLAMNFRARRTAAATITGITL